MAGWKWPKMGPSLLLLLLAVPGYNMSSRSHHERLGVGGNVHFGATQTGALSVNTTLHLDHNPCHLVICGPLSICTPDKFVGKCSCAPGAVGKPPFCHHPCAHDIDCDKDSVCVNNTCVDPCENACGDNALCHMEASCDGLLGDGLTAHAVHTLILNPCKRLPVCTCPKKYKGDATIVCVPESPCDEEVDPCGPNSNCEASNGNAMCSCQAGYAGSPPSCQHECEQSDECPSSQACLQNKCVDPCAGACGPDELCHVENREAVCTQPQCEAGQEVTEEPPAEQNPCDPNPCGPNSYCVSDDDNAMCSCKNGYRGPPPNCQRFLPCDSWPCGSNSVCVDHVGVAMCWCVNSYEGRAPDCHLKCKDDKNCTKSETCVDGKCKALCDMANCGANTYCSVVQRQAICSCFPGNEGDPNVGCEPTSKRKFDL